MIVIADPLARSLTWVPRDLWSPSLYDRVNGAFALGGTARLISALRELGFQCDHAIVVRRRATEAAAAHLSVDVPVSEPLDFLYPLEPTKRIQEGSKTVSFRPPCERLEGERIHQWVGARRGLSRLDSDFGRILRQQVFLRALLNQGFDFGRVIQDDSLVQLSSGNAIEELRQVRPGWDMTCFDHVRHETIDGMMVLIKQEGEQPERPRRNHPELAAVVLARGAPRRTVAAVRSLLAQNPAVEIMVVNSGGGDMGRLLARHGIDIAVIDCDERLSVSAARTIGVRATRAPYVAFLPADFLAAPGWAKKRLKAHRAGKAAVGRDVLRSALGNPPVLAKRIAIWLRRLMGMPHKRAWGASYERTLLEKHGASWESA
ncbi:glycosyltransferase [Dongia deserti]|uniref:glycosyltransferase n=1 Tax=Dongia deserti TaxID=2268030 RepID=UPI0013C3F974|nr:glycosyltransferase [Dongia deserti]